MGSILHCLSRCCCEDEEEEIDGYVTSSISGAPGNASMTRVLVENSHQSYQIAPQRSRSDDDEEEEEDDDNDEDGDERDVVSRNCCRPSDYFSNNNNINNASAGRSECSTSAQHTSIHEFFRNLAERWSVYDSLATADHSTEEATIPSAAASDFTKHFCKRDGSPHVRSPLRQASTFDSSSDIPSIPKDEVVLPGSDLQQRMAMAMMEKYPVVSVESQGDECVICMEGFDATNPRMPTLCGCGENKTYFHLPCLYQWVEQSQDCPSCRQRLRWEEF